MKTILNIITTITIICLAVTATMAQVQPPQPPEPPSTTVSTHSDTKSSTSYSYSVSDDDDKGSGGNVSISTSSNDDSYSFRLRYDGSKDDQIKRLLYKEMGTNNLESSGSKDVWKTESGGDEVYEIKFSKGKLNMDLDKEIASEAITNKIVELGKSIRTIITGKSDEDRNLDRKAQQLQREADRLQRDADRMRREAVRLQEQEQRNIDRIKREADRLAREAERAGDNARRSGGVSAVESELLKDNKTKYDAIDKGTAWVLPRLLPSLTAQLINDGLVKAGDDINLLNEKNSLYINGTQILKMSLQFEKYNRLFQKANIRPDNYFSLNKSKNHIIVVDNNANIDNVLFTLRTLDLIPEEDEKLILELNGNTIIKNGVSLPASQVKVFNKVLLGENVILAPGKVLEIKGEDNYTLGYSLNNGKVHLGTWQMGR